MVGKKAVIEKLMSKVLLGNNVSKETGSEKIEDILLLFGERDLFFFKSSKVTFKFHVMVGNNFLSSLK